MEFYQVYDPLGHILAERFSRTFAYCALFYLSYCF